MMKQNCKISKLFIYFTGRTRTCLIMIDYDMEELHLQNVQFWNVCTATFSVTPPTVEAPAKLVNYFIQHNLESSVSLHN